MCPHQYSLNPVFASGEVRLAVPSHHAGAGGGIRRGGVPRPEMPSARYPGWSQRSIGIERVHGRAYGLRPSGTRGPQSPAGACLHLDRYALAPGRSADVLDRHGAAVDEAVAARSAWGAASLRTRSATSSLPAEHQPVGGPHSGGAPAHLSPGHAGAAATLLDGPSSGCGTTSTLQGSPEAGGPTPGVQARGYGPSGESDAITAWARSRWRHARRRRDGDTLLAHRWCGSSRHLLGRALRTSFGAPEVRGAEPLFVEVPRGGVPSIRIDLHVAKPIRRHARGARATILFRDGCTRAPAAFSPVGGAGRHRRRGGDREP